MRPKELHVFDGLRITTEHLNHLQGALRSGLVDLRRLTGAGCVLEGFALETQGGALVVHPGLGFDRAGNRVVSDEAIGMTVGPLPPGARRWVVARYREATDGAVDERPTMAWDACTLALADAPPTDDALVLGVLETLGDGGIALAAAEAPDAPAGSMPVASSPVASSPVASSPAASSPAASTAAAVGVARLAGSADDAARLGRWLRALADAPTSGAPDVPAITLASVPLADAAGATLATHATLRLTVGGSAGEATAHGEAAASGGGVTQGALVQGVAGAEVREGCVARAHVAAAEGAAEDAAATLVGALALELGLARDAAGTWRVEARLGWRDAAPARAAIAAAAAAPPDVEWQGTLLWRAAGGGA